MVNETLNTIHTHGYLVRIIFFDHFSFELLYRKRDRIEYYITTRAEVERIIHDDRNRVVPCLFNDTIRKIMEKIFNIQIPKVSSIYDCGISDEEFNHCVWLLSPLLYKPHLELSEKELEEKFESPEAPFILVRRYREICDTFTKTF